MTTYLLSCECGHPVRVEVGQAGGQVACPACHAQLEVPTLRKLRHLPAAPPEARAASQRRQPPTSWGTRQGVIATGLILAALLAGAALWSRLTEPTVPQFDPEARLRAVEHGLEELTPVQSWKMWIKLYRPLAERGFPVIEDPHKHAIEQQIAEKRFFQRMTLAVAAVFAIIAIAAAVWPRATPPSRMGSPRSGNPSSPG